MSFFAAGNSELEKPSRDLQIHFAPSGQSTPFWIALQRCCEISRTSIPEVCEWTRVNSRISHHASFRLLDFQWDRKCDRSGNEVLRIHLQWNGSGEGQSFSLFLDGFAKREKKSHRVNNKRYYWQTFVDQLSIENREGDVYSPRRRVLFTHRLGRIDLRFLRTNRNDGNPSFSIPTTRSRRRLQTVITSYQRLWLRWLVRERKNSRSTRHRYRKPNLQFPSQRFPTLNRPSPSSNVLLDASTYWQYVPTDHISTSIPLLVVVVVRKKKSKFPKVSFESVRKVYKSFSSVEIGDSDDDRWKGQSRKKRRRLNLEFQKDYWNPTDSEVEEMKSKTKNGEKGRKWVQQMKA